MTPTVDFKTRYLARIGDQYIHESLQGLTPHKQWAWKPTRERWDAAKKEYALVQQASPVRILRDIIFITNGVG